MGKKRYNLTFSSKISPNQNSLNEWNFWNKICTSRARNIFCLEFLTPRCTVGDLIKRNQAPPHLLIVSALYCPTKIILPYKSESHLTRSSECNYFHKLMPYYKGLENWVSVSSRIKKPSLLQTKVATMHACNLDSPLLILMHQAMEQGKV